METAVKERRSRVERAARCSMVSKNTFDINGEDDTHPLKHETDQICTQIRSDYFKSCSNEINTVRTLSSFNRIKFLHSSFRRQTELRGPKIKIKQFKQLESADMLNMHQNQLTATLSSTSLNQQWV